MSNIENLHAGHRERMIEKFLKSPLAFSDHEILEVLLFYAIPRKNTNDIAHRLLKTFGTIEKVFTASSDELKSVNGIGDKAATEIMVIGRLIDIVSKKELLDERLSTLAELKEVLIEYFYGIRDEKFLLILLDAKYKVITKITFSDKNREQVTADIPEIAKAFALHKPTFAVISHNHPSGNIEPSKEDDATTQKIDVLCNIHCVKLIDHVIVSGDAVYSYHHDNRLDEIKKQTNKIFNSL